MEFVLRTALDEQAYEELDIEEVEPTMGKPISEDVEIKLWEGDVKLSQRAMRKTLRLDFRGAPTARILQLERWLHDRTRLRLNGNWGAHTQWYQAFQRRNEDTNAIGSQKGSEPVFDRDVTNGYATYLGPDGRLYIASNDIPRYERSAFGMNGILLEGDSINHFTYTHPSSGNVLWTTYQGSPQINWQDRHDSIVTAMTGTLQVYMASGEGVKLSSSAVTASTDYTFFVYVIGHGNINLQIYNGSTSTVLMTLNNIPLDADNWLKLVAKDFALSNGNWIDARITSNGATLMYLAGHQLEPHEFATRYIHGMSGGQPTKELDSMKIEDVKGLPGAGMATMAFQLPDLSGNKNLAYLLTNDAVNFKFYYDPSNKKFYFQKYTATYKVEYTTSKLAGDDIILTVGWDDTKLVILENGVLKDSTACTVPYNAETFYYVGNNTTKEAPWTPIAFIRIDSALMPNDDIISLHDMYLDQDSRIWMTRFEGRDMRISSMTSPLRVGPGRYDSAVILEEIQAERTGTIERR